MKTEEKAPSVGMSIGLAVEALKRGFHVRREGWNGKGMWLGLAHPSGRAPSIGEPADYRQMTVPFVFMCTAQGDLIPWLCSQADLLANDWELTT